jgi:putative transposase
MRSYRKGSHTVHDLKVHLVWVTKYRYQVLTKQIGYRLRNIIRQICDSHDIHIIQGRVSKDHVHLYVSYPPKLSVSGPFYEREKFPKNSGRISSTWKTLLG